MSGSRTKTGKDERRVNNGTWDGNVVAVLKCCLLLSLVYFNPVRACPVENQHIEVTVKGQTLFTEVAADHTSHMCGLAFRHHLPPDHGMWFAYAQDQKLGFWMKDTFIPLSIAFLDASGRILEIHDMDPRTPARVYVSGVPARYALEVNQGWFSEHGIAVGDTVEFDLQAGPEIYRYTADR